MSDTFLIRRAAQVLEKVLAAHEMSSVDWEAMKQAKHLLPLLRGAIDTKEACVCGISHAAFANTDTRLRCAVCLGVVEEAK